MMISEAHNQRRPNKALHRTAIPLRSIAAGKLDRYAAYEKKVVLKK